MSFETPKEPSLEQPREPSLLSDWYRAKRQEVSATVAAQETTHEEEGEDA